jgi:hypothetical protein
MATVVLRKSVKLAVRYFFVSMYGGHGPLLSAGGNAVVEGDGLLVTSVLSGEGEGDSRSAVAKGLLAEGDALLVRSAASGKGEGDSRSAAAVGLLAVLSGASSVTGVSVWLVSDGVEKGASPASSCARTAAADSNSKQIQKQQLDGFIVATGGNDLTDDLCRRHPNK